MANADLTTYPKSPALVEASTTNSVLTLSPDRAYTLEHTGLTTGGSASTGAVYVSTAAAALNDAAGDEPAVDMTEGTRKAVLLSGKSLTIGPGFARADIRTASGSPVVMVLPTEPYHGNY